ncbi:hypothetical protein HDU86_002194 [Geranomyces michiganensis]|nr:hypothetical protein HDU86_002194 [Geranomyces michiganensis]
MPAPRSKLFLVPVTLDSLSAPLDRTVTLIHEAAALLLLPCGPRPHPSSGSLALKIIVSCPELAAGAADRWHAMQSMLAVLYAAAGKAAHERDYPVLDVYVIFEEWCGYDPWLGDEDGTAVVGYAEDQAALALINTRRAKDRLSHLHFIPVPEAEPDVDLSTADPPSPVPLPAVSEPAVHAYDNVAMGGTFDHLHGGHKILLTAAVWLTRQRLICGVMDPPRLAKKKGAKYMESLDTRMNAVKRFLDLIRRDTVRYDVVPIADEYGPTRTDPNIQAIVGSLESQRGCEAVNTLRAEKGLCALDVFTIDVISSSSANVQLGAAMEDKISSTAIRQYLEKLDAP